MNIATPSRRELLYGAAAGAIACAVPAARGAQISPAQADAAILIFLEGGLSHLDSFDPKPEASADVRCPFGAIRTSADGVQMAGLWEETARIAHHLTFMRAVTHDRAAHEPAAEQMLGGLPVMWVASTDSFDRDLLTARKLIDCGARIAAVSCGGWDMHANLAGGLQEHVPPVDRALADLIRHLDASGRLERTLVGVVTEFGRSPRMNRDGGRDHWPGVFSVALAGAGIAGGQVVGGSSPDGMEPAVGAVSPARLKATILQKLGLRSAVAATDALIPELC